MQSSIYSEEMSSPYILDFIILLSLDNDVLETSKRRAMFYNILSQIFFFDVSRTSLSSESKIMQSSIYSEEMSSPYILDFIILLSLDNDVLETSKRRAMFHNILTTH